MPDFDPANFSSLDPKQFAQLVKSTPTDQLKAALQSEHRTAILDTIFGQIAGQFRADRAGGTNAVIHWNVGDRPDGGADNRRLAGLAQVPAHDTYELVIANSTCTLSPKPEHEPTLALNLGAVDFLKVISGNANPVMLFMTGKLKAKGDLGLAANIANLFDTPKA